MRIMNRLVATEGRDKGGKLALITSRLNAEGGGREKGERKEGNRAGNLDSAFSCDDGLVPVCSFATTSPISCVFAKTSQRRHLNFLERDPRAIFHEGERYSFGISLDDLRFPLRYDGRKRKKVQMKNKILYNHKDNIMPI